VAKETIKCKCGADSGYPRPVVSVGSFLKKTGWEYLFFYDGSSQELCRKCGDKAIKLGEQVVEITGSDFSVIPALLGKYGRKKGE
jgi:hypothetical protein